ncbi:hypothetical protein SBA3_2300022 [Candidatus Sulfopaludibacter sp. SbA3]|nr:hypothetical protein SBA3_2300022 [Candidatus Sulfopaludibacter sp. SbA3]
MIGQLRTGVSDRRQAIFRKAERATSQRCDSRMLNVGVERRGYARRIRFPRARTLPGPCCSGATANWKGRLEGEGWWVKFAIDISHRLAWNVVQELGHVLNYLSVNERLPTVFKPVSPPPYANGGWSTSFPGSSSVPNGR